MQINAEILFANDGQLTKNQLVKQFVNNQSGGHSSFVLEGKQVVALKDKQWKSLDDIRNIAGEVSRDLSAQKVQTATISAEQLEQKWLSADEAVTAFVEGWHLGAYHFDRYQSKKANPITVLEIKDADQAAVKAGVVRAEAMKFSRDLMNELSDVLNPQTYPKVLKDYFKGTKVKVDVLGKKEIEERQMNGVLTVCRGSKYEPSFVEMTLQTDASKPLVALVGKGVTYDSGGISLKGGRDDSDMRMDMGGSAAVCGAMSLLAYSDAKVNVVALIPMVENTPGPEAVMPGEVIQYKNGISVQVGNTDAEGRLILADGLIRAEELGAEYTVDIATLTGAVVSALGTEVGGVFGDEELAFKMKKIGDQNGDFIWPLPLVDVYEESLDSAYADCNNISSMSEAGAITAGLFLRKFAPKKNWLHVDMAGVMDKQKTKGYYTKSATGYGARLLADYTTSLK
ncbi:leucyl aminopeptidase family protein [Mammaliicoccus sciuri]|uniref:Probable cytosol aminopeptidase n=2 Tax=Sporosarcina newyorkensis TaxID=759851 RepID=A0A1T4YKX7_9BACL|nr:MULTISPECIES: leucyl aminopeptidase family protein [Sporosarcina]EGQ21674.1 aminopeptidase A/I [Sporosarcina newyorkensis 2681]MBY0221278.1 leucyl aminopeptidase family protein [Sporosarcina aquimarina]SKB02474.1 leucyl aminopeptidase [Sporosarcina newyorkensis]